MLAHPTNKGAARIRATALQIDLFIRPPDKKRNFQAERKSDWSPENPRLRWVLATGQACAKCRRVSTGRKQGRARVTSNADQGPLGKQEQPVEPSRRIVLYIARASCPGATANGAKRDRSRAIRCTDSAYGMLTVMDLTDATEKENPAILLK